MIILPAMKYVEYMADLEERIHAGGPVFLFFYREDSPECRVLAKSLARLTRRYPKVESYVVDLEKNPTASGQFLAYTVPTVMLYYGARPVFKRSEDIVLAEINMRLSQASASK